MATRPDEESTSQETDFERAGEMRRPSFVSEYMYLLKTTRKWWMFPLIFLLLTFGSFMILSSTGAAPFIYALF
jgi:hypothetical protein